MPVTILITGHRGYIGSALFRFLSEQREIDNVIGYDLLDGNDILDYNNLLNYMRRYHPDIVIHLAAITSQTACNSDPKLCITVNSHGTNNVLRAMKEVDCNHIIYSSSAAVYGDSKIFPYKESMKVTPSSPYGFSKLLGELAIHNHYEFKNNYGNYLILRLFNVVGTSGYKDIDNIKGMKYDRLFPALETGNVIIYGTDYPTFDGTCERDFISLKDTCGAFMKAITAIGCYIKIREIINICSGETSSIQSVIDIWNNISNRINKTQRPDYNNLPYIIYNYGPKRKWDNAKICGKNKRATRLLTWKPTKKIEDIIYDLAHDKIF